MKFSIMKLIPVITAFLQHFMKEKDHKNKIKNHDRTEEKISTIENLIVRLERKLKETREQVEDLHRQIIINRTINIILSVVVLVLIFWGCRSF